MFYRCIGLQNTGEDFYSLMNFTDRLLEYLGGRSRDEETKYKPLFFLILLTVHYTGCYRYWRKTSDTSLNDLDFQFREGAIIYLLQMQGAVPHPRRQQGRDRTTRMTFSTRGEYLSLCQTIGMREL